MRKHCRKQHTAWLQAIDADARDAARQPSGSRSELYCIQRAVQREWIEQRKRARTDGDGPAEGAAATQAKQAPSASGDARKPAAADPRQHGAARAHGSTAAADRLGQWVDQVSSAPHVPQQQQWGAHHSATTSSQPGPAPAQQHHAASSSAAAAAQQPRPGSGSGLHRTAFFTLTQQMPPPLKRGESLGDFELAGAGCTTPTAAEEVEFDGSFSGTARQPTDDALSENTPPPSAEASFFAANVFA